MRIRVAAIVPAAGKGRRFKSKTRKLLVPVAGKPLLAHTLINLKKSFPFTEIILAVDPLQKENIGRLLKKYGLRGIKVVGGGKTRSQSVLNGLSGISKECDWALVHDAARPFVDRGLVRRLLEGAKKTGAAICALPVTATVKAINIRNQMIIRTEDRDRLYLAQTPQVFKKDLLLRRYQALGRKAFRATDEAALFDRSDVRVKVIEGEAKNIKITTSQDLELMKFYLKERF